MFDPCFSHYKCITHLQTTHTHRSTGQSLHTSTHTICDWHWHKAPVTGTGQEVVFRWPRLLGVRHSWFNYLSLFLLCWVQRCLATTRSTPHPLTPTLKTPPASVTHFATLTPSPCSRPLQLTTQPLAVVQRACATWSWSYARPSTTPCCWALTWIHLHTQQQWPGARRQRQQLRQPQVRVPVGMWSGLMFGRPLGITSGAVLSCSSNSVWCSWRAAVGSPL